MSSGEQVVLALNSGSSSLKVGCYRAAGDQEQLVLTGSAQAIGRNEGSLALHDGDGAVLLEQDRVCETQEQALERLAEAIGKHLHAAPVAIGHRVVHGGPKLRVHQRITPQVMEDLQAATHLAPLHIPQALTLMRQAQKLYPGVPQFACFDTTFHRTMPAVATHLPVAQALFEQGVQRYGFHGLSCESVMRRLGATPPARVVIAHLGNGSSVTAVRDGASLDTTMSLSPTGGIPMSTRTGDIDPEVLLYLVRHQGLSPDALETYVNHSCGLAGLSGGESDMQALLARGDPAAALAIDVFCTAIRKAVGGFATLMGGLDLLVFTGGIGEHSEVVRTRVSANLAFLFQSAKVNSVVLAAQEELEIAYHCRHLLKS